MTMDLRSHSNSLDILCQGIGDEMKDLLKGDLKKEGYDKAIAALDKKIENSTKVEETLSLLTQRSKMQEEISKMQEERIAALIAGLEQHGGRKRNRTDSASTDEDDDHGKDTTGGMSKTLQKKVRLLKLGKLSPSAATWQVMRAGGILPELSHFIGLISNKPEVDQKCKLKQLLVNQEIWANSNPSNEGHPTLLCGIFINHIVSDINASLGPKMVKFEIFPVVREEQDSRENKLSDYSIYRVYNHVTYIVIEVKLSVGASLTAADKDSFAQLFLEAEYVYMKEGNSKLNSTMLCVLTDGTTWHIITTDISHKLIQFRALLSISTKTVDPWDSNLSVICDQFLDHIKQSMKLS